MFPLLAMCPRSQRWFKACHAPGVTKSMRTHRILLQLFFWSPTYCLLFRRLRERTASPRRSATVSLEIAIVVPATYVENESWCFNYTKPSPNQAPNHGSSLAFTAFFLVSAEEKRRIKGRSQDLGSLKGLSLRWKSDTHLPWSIDDSLHWDQHPCTMTTLVSCQDACQEISGMQQMWTQQIVELAYLSASSGWNFVETLHQ